MKRKLFTLFLAIVTLSVFQANAQQVRWILADTSGLAKNAFHSDSFPQNKLGLYNWLNVDGNSIKVHSRVDTANNYEIYEDMNSKFNFDAVSDSSFKIKRANAGDFLGIQHEDSTHTVFEIVQFSGNRMDIQRLDGRDTIEGYLLYPQQGTSGPDSANLVLAGVDKNGNLSFKKFSEFAAHLDSVPGAPYLSYQFDGDTVPGRLYQSREVPYFQVYSQGTDGSDSALIAGESNPIVNWGVTSLNKVNNFVYTYFDFTLNRENGRVSFKEDTAQKVVTLESILKYQETREPIIVVIDTINVERFDYSAEQTNNRLFIYANNDGKLAVTAVSQDNGWLNHEPDTFLIGTEKVFFYLQWTEDNKFMLNLDTVIYEQFGYKSDLNPATNHIERYIYKESDDWRPLYIQAILSCDSLPYEYVTSQWLSENYYDIAAVSQEIFDAFGAPTGSSVSTDSATVTLFNADNAAKFLFEYAATIRKDSTIKGHTVKFSNYKEIDLFYIKNGSEYLTVLDTTIFAGTINDSTVTNTQLGWEEKLTVDSLRQAFAIVFNSKDSIITLLPVASYQWKLTGIAPQYNKTALHYNQGIGKKNPNPCGDLFFDLDTAWYITQMSKTGNPAQRLVIADPTSSTTTSREVLWFKMTKAYELADIGDDCDDEVFAVYNKTGEYYYPLTGTKVKGEVTDGMIRHHWTARDTTINDIRRWIFTPELATIYGHPLNRTNLNDTFIALNVGDSLIELISGTGYPYRRDTITVVCAGHSSPFLNLDPYVGVSKRVAILESLNGTKNISYLSSTDSLHEAISKRVKQNVDSTYTKLTVYNSNVQYLGKNNRHQVPYYVFSYKDEEGDEYFLSAQQGIRKDSVRWVKLVDPERKELLQQWENHTDKYPSFKFCLPYTDGEDHNADSLRFEQPVYLQTLNSSQVTNYSLITGKGDSLESVEFSKALEITANYIEEHGIYSAIDQYNNNIDESIITFWKFFKEDVIGSGWARIDSVVDAAEPQRGKNGAFTNVDNFSPGTVFVVPGSEEPVNYGILTGSDQGKVNVELTLVSAGRAQIGYEKDSIWYYRIKHGDLYLTDAIDSAEMESKEDNIYAYKYFDTKLPYAFFTTNGLAVHTPYNTDGVYADNAFRQTFALQYVEPVNERKDFYFFVVSSANYNDLYTSNYRYLSRLDARLVFVGDKDKDKALQFQLGKVDDNGNYTDVKVIGVPATIYGVAGGIKVANATGAVAIYTIDGRLVTVKAAVSPDQTIAVPAGIYIVRNGTNAAKVVVR